MSDLQRFSAQLGPRRRQSRNRGRGQLRQRWITLGEIVRKQHGVRVGVSVDDAKTDEKSHHAGADDLQQIRDGCVRDAGQGVEHGLAIAAAAVATVAAIGASHEDSIQKHGMQMRVQLHVGACPLHDSHGSAATPDGSLDLHAAPVPTQNRVDEDARDHRQAMRAKPRCKSPQSTYPSSSARTNLGSGAPANPSSAAA